MPSLSLFHYEKENVLAKELAIFSGMKNIAIGPNSKYSPLQLLVILPYYIELQVKWCMCKESYSGPT